MTGMQKTTYLEKRRTRQKSLESQIAKLMSKNMGETFYDDIDMCERMIKILEDWKSFFYEKIEEIKNDYAVDGGSHNQEG